VELSEVTVTDACNLTVTCSGALAVGSPAPAPRTLQSPSEGGADRRREGVGGAAAAGASAGYRRTRAASSYVGGGGGGGGGGGDGGLGGDHFSSSARRLSGSGPRLSDATTGAVAALAAAAAVGVSFGAGGGSDGGDSGRRRSGSKDATSHDGGGEGGGAARVPSPPRQHPALASSKSTPGPSRAGAPSRGGLGTPERDGSAGGAGGGAGVDPDAKLARSGLRGAVSFHIPLAVELDSLWQGTFPAYYTFELCRSKTASKKAAQEEGCVVCWGLGGCGCRRSEGAA
jgi:hypothetical protein